MRNYELEEFSNEVKPVLEELRENFGQGIFNRCLSELSRGIIEPQNVELSDVFSTLDSVRANIIPQENGSNFGSLKYD